MTIHIQSRVMASGTSVTRRSMVWSSWWAPLEVPYDAIDEPCLLKCEPRGNRRFPIERHLGQHLGASCHLERAFGFKLVAY